MPTRRMRRVGMQARLGADRRGMREEAEKGARSRARAEESRTREVRLAGVVWLEWGDGKKGEAIPGILDVDI